METIDQVRPASTHETTASPWKGLAWGAVALVVLCALFVVLSIVGGR